MNRILLLRIFYIALLLPLVIILVLELQESDANEMTINKYKSVLETAANDEDSTVILNRLIEKRAELKGQKESILAGCFDPEETTFYDFSGLVMGKDISKDMRIEDYRTYAESDPPAISLTVSGSAEDIMEYLYLLEGMEKMFPVPRFSISLDNTDGIYRADLTVNYMTGERYLKEVLNGN